VTSITFKGLLNFTNSQGTSGPSSGNCLINSLINNEQQPMQEVRSQNALLYSLMAIPSFHPLRRPCFFGSETSLCVEVLSSSQQMQL